MAHVYLTILICHNYPFETSLNYRLVLGRIIFRLRYLQLKVTLFGQHLVHDYQFINEICARIVCYKNAIYLLFFLRQKRPMAASIFLLAVS